MRRELSDPELITASRDDATMFVPLFDRHFDSIHRYLRRRVGKDIADDLAAETFMEAFDSRLKYQSSARDARPWLFGIALNLLRHHYRHEERELRALQRTGVDPIASAPAGVASGLSAEVAGALAEIGRDDRDVLLLFAWGEMSYGEIAEALQVPIGTVRSRLNRARCRLQERLRRPAALVVEDEHDTKRRLTDG